MSCSNSSGLCRQGRSAAVCLKRARNQKPIIAERPARASGTCHRRSARCTSQESLCCAKSYFGSCKPPQRSNGFVAIWVGKDELAQFLCFAGNRPYDLLLNCHKRSALRGSVGAPRKMNKSIPD